MSPGSELTCGATPSHSRSKAEGDVGYWLEYSVAIDIPKMEDRFACFEKDFGDAKRAW